MKKLFAIASLTFLLVMSLTTPWQGNAQEASLGGDGIQVFEKNLYFGMRDSVEVSNLQEFLTDQGYYAGPVSGNFYLLTLQGVRKFQSAHNISATGFFGIKSRTAANEILKKLINELCRSEDDCSGGGTLPLPQLSIATASNLDANVGQRFVATFQVSGGSGSYAIDGRGEVPGLNFTGTYCGENMFCAQMISPDTIHLVGTPTRAGKYDVTIVAKEQNGVIYCIQAENCPTNEQFARYGKATFTIVVAGNGMNTQAPVISGVKGPTTLRVNEEGTWTISASNRAGGSLSYRVVWGDEFSNGQNGATSAPTDLSYRQTATFSHSYQFPGSYTPVFYVANDQGGQAKTSLSVVVGKGEDTSSRVKVISPNGGELWQVGQTNTIKWSTYYGPTPITMDNSTTGGVGLGLSMVRTVRISLLQQVQCFRAPCYDVETVIAEQAVDNGTYSWTIPSSVMDGSYRVKISAPAYPCIPPRCEVNQPCTMIACPRDVVMSGTSAGQFRIVTSPVVANVAIGSMTPSVGAVGMQVTLFGKGFTSTNNTLHFGFGVVPNLTSSENGTRLTFTVPTYLSSGCSYTTPPCMMPAMLTQVGTYAVSVSNANGQSNELKFEVNATNTY